MQQEDEGSTDWDGRTAVFGMVDPYSPKDGI
jgi:hypothetical protein